MKYLIANWKSHKTISQAVEWMNQFQTFLNNSDDVKQKLLQNKFAIIICPPSYALAPLKAIQLQISNYSLGIQNISPFPEGSYTGEIAAHLVSDLVGFTLIGHSERRKYFHETNGDISLRTDSAIFNKIEPIVCIRSEHDEIPNNVSLIAYEPVESIGSGKNSPLKEVLDMKKKLSLKPNIKFIYGGSVDTKNCHEYLSSAEIDGLLIGTASLDPATFFSIVTQA